MTVKEVAAVYVPCLVSEMSDYQDKVYWLISIDRLIDWLISIDWLIEYLFYATFSSFHLQSNLH
jgi:hypothetical protein